MVLKLTAKFCKTRSYNIRLRQQNKQQSLLLNTWTSVCSSAFRLRSKGRWCY